MGDLQARFRRFKRKPGSDLMLYRALFGNRFVGPLDDFDTSAFTLTTAVLYSSQLGQPMFRIRRSADDNHCDVLPDTSELINGTYWLGLNSPVQNFETASDATTLGEFVASAGYSDPDSLGSASDAFVRTAYDPSGNDRDAEQATAASQPQIVASGALVVDANGYPTIKFDGVDDHFLTTATWTHGSGFIVMQSAGELNPNVLAGIGTLNSIYYFAESQGEDFAQGAGSLQSASRVADTDVHLVSSMLAADSVYLDGELRISGELGAVSDARLVVGARGNQTTFWSDNISLVISFSDDQSADRAAIEAKLAEVLGITLP